jgi:hypothetical protein
MPNIFAGIRRHERFARSPQRPDDPAALTAFGNGAGLIRGWSGTDRAPSRLR